ncbi:hypothetical protein B0T12DRAFT_391773 [Alternaria alternata]|nr:hypothetical protein B0T12DRAFT_391773 [Alternaria alternata]
MALISLLFLLSSVQLSTSARDITFPPVFGYSSQQIIPQQNLGLDITHAKFAGLMTYANLPYVHCLAPEQHDVVPFDIAILGAPFDTGVTARPGARFGPSGIRQGSSRISPASAWSIYTGENVFEDWAKIVDCGDAPLTFLIVSARPTNSSEHTTPKIVTLGGDEDTWDPEVLGGGISHYAGVNHGTFLHIAHEEGLIRNTSIHAGIRAPMGRPKGDLRNDIRCGFEIVKAREIDQFGVAGVIARLKSRVAGTKVYISVDIDVLDPAFAPELSPYHKRSPSTQQQYFEVITLEATGTAEVGGWTTRELLSILDGLEGLDVIGADVVEVAPIYDNPGETTVLAAAEVVHSLIALMCRSVVLAESLGRLVE